MTQVLYEQNSVTIVVRVLRSRTKEFRWLVIQNLFKNLPDLAKTQES